MSRRRRAAPSFAPGDRVRLEPFPHITGTVRAVSTFRDAYNRGRLTTLASVRWDGDPDTLPAACRGQIGVGLLLKGDAS